MKLSTAIKKLEKLGTLNKETSKVQFNGEDDSIVLDDMHDFSIKLKNGIIEFTTYKRESEVTDFTITDGTNNRIYPKNLTQAIKWAS